MSHLSVSEKESTHVGFILHLYTAAWSEQHESEPKQFSATPASSSNPTDSSSPAVTGIDLTA